MLMTRSRYVLSGKTGRLRRGFPVEMGPIQAGAACGDLTATGTLDIVVCDTLGNIAAYGADGKRLWDRVISGSVSQVGGQLMRP
jgi:hypothetical protein